MPKKQVYIAVDGGGSKTDFCVEDISTSEKRFYAYGSTNYKNTGVAAAENNLVGAFREICRKEQINSGNILGMVLGLAGYDSPSDRRIYQDMAVHLELPPEKLLLCNDCELAFLAATDPPGVCVVAGTGSIAFGFDKNGLVQRCGGWGGLLSDQGSGFWIGRRLLEELLLHCDGMAAWQPVFDPLLAQYGIGSLRDAPYALTELDITGIASAARTVMDFAATGDSFCRGIINEAATHIRGLVLTLYRTVGLENEQSPAIVLTGGLFRDRLFREECVSKMADQIPGANFLHISSNTSENGIRLARRMFVNN